MQFWNFLFVILTKNRYFCRHNQITMSYDIIK